jgi:GPH family glycoside/pentoside/hexuronide:cation symporter
MMQGIILFTLAGLPVATISVLQRPLIADVIDADEKLTGYRREAMYNGMEGLFTRSASGLAWVVSSQLFILFGATKENPGGILLCGPVAGALLFIGLMYFRKYPIEK